MEYGESLRVTELNMTAEADLGAELTRCRELLDTYAPWLAEGEFEVIQTGWGNLVVVINDAVVLRVPRRPEIEPSIRRERRLLRHIGSILPIAVPQPWSWPADIAHPPAIMIYKLIRGEPFTGHLLQGAPQAQLALQLAEVLAALHRFPVLLAADLLEQEVTSAAAWRQEYRNLFSQVESQVLPLLTDPLRSALIRVWRNFLETDDNFDFSPALVHRDLMSGNLLYNRAEQRFSGLIDWEDATVGDPAIDFAGLLIEYGADFAHKALDLYRGDIDSAFWARCEFYARIVPIYGVIFGLDMDDTALVQEQLQSLEMAILHGSWLSG